MIQIVDLVKTYGKGADSLVAPIIRKEENATDKSVVGDIY